MSEPLRLEETAADVMVNRRYQPPFMPPCTVAISVSELSILRTNSARWEWVENHSSFLNREYVKAVDAAIAAKKGAGNA